MKNNYRTLLTLLLATALITTIFAPATLANSSTGNQQAPKLELQNQNQQKNSSLAKKQLAIQQLSSLPINNKQEPVNLLESTQSHYRDRYRINDIQVFQNDSKAIQKLKVFASRQHANEIAKISQLVYEADRQTTQKVIQDIKEILNNSHYDLNRTQKRKVEKAVQKASDKLREAENTVKGKNTKKRVKSYAKAIQELGDSWNTSQHILDYLDTNTKPSFDIIRSDQIENESYILMGEIYDIQSYELGNATIYVNGTKAKEIKINRDSGQAPIQLFATGTKPGTSTQFSANISIGGPSKIKVKTTDYDTNVSLNVSDPEPRYDSVIEAIAGPDGVVSFDELRKAIWYWANDEPVPQTGGKKVDYLDLRRLFRMWKKNSDTAQVASLKSLISKHEEGELSFKPQNVQKQEISAVIRVDGDGLPDLYEMNVTKTDPLDPDSDSERTNTDESNNGVIDSKEDLDGDGLTNRNENFYDTDPLKADTDGDGLNDGVELGESTLDPLSKDSNNNSVIDSKDHHDSDGLNNKEEAKYNTSVDYNDTDRDGLNDSEEIRLGTNPLRADSDGDGMSDEDEIDLGLDPNDPDSDNDGVEDGEEKVVSTKKNQSLGVKVDVKGEGNVADTVSIENGDKKIFGTSEISDAKRSPFVSLESEKNFSSANITIKYDESRVKNEENLTIFRHNESLQTFVPVNSTVDKQNNTVTAQTPHFSTYVVFNYWTWYGYFLSIPEYNYPVKEVPALTNRSIVASEYELDEPINETVQGLSIHRRFYPFYFDFYDPRGHLALALNESSNAEVTGRIEFEDAKAYWALSDRWDNPGKRGWIDEYTYRFRIGNSTSLPHFTEDIHYGITGTSPSFKVIITDTNVSDLSIKLGGDNVTEVKEGESVVLASMNSSDIDGDGLSNKMEKEGIPTGYGGVETDPYDRDTDGDGLLDGLEVSPKNRNFDRYVTVPVIIEGEIIARQRVLKLESDPTKLDSDGDGLRDWEEWPTHQGDGYYSTYGITVVWNEDDANKLYEKIEKSDKLKDKSDVDYRYAGSKTVQPNPLDADSDDDGLNDYQEYVRRTDALNKDTDGDGALDSDELNYGGDPKVYDVNPPNVTVKDIDAHRNNFFLRVTDPSKLKKIKIKIGNKVINCFESTKNCLEDEDVSNKTRFSKFIAADTSFKTDLGNLAGASVKVIAVDTHGNKKVKNVYYQPDVISRAYRKIVDIRRAADLTSIATPPLGIVFEKAAEYTEGQMTAVAGFMSGFLTGMASTLNNIKNLKNIGSGLRKTLKQVFNFVKNNAEKILRKPKKHIPRLLEGIWETAMKIYEKRGQIISNFIGAFTKPVIKKQKAGNPYDEDSKPYFHDTYKYSFYAGYIGEKIAAMFLGDKGLSKALKGARQFKVIDDILTKAESGVLKAKKLLGITKAEKMGYKIALSLAERIKDKSKDLAAVSRSVLARTESLTTKFRWNQDIKSSNEKVLDLFDDPGDFNIPQYRKYIARTYDTTNLRYKGSGKILLDKMSPAWADKMMGFKGKLGDSFRYSIAKAKQAKVSIDKIEDVIWKATSKTYASYHSIIKKIVAGGPTWGNGVKFVDELGESGFKKFASLKDVDGVSDDTLAVLARKSGKHGAEAIEELDADQLKKLVKKLAVKCRAGVTSLSRSQATLKAPDENCFDDKIDISGIGNFLNKYGKLDIDGMSDNVLEKVVKHINNKNYESIDKILRRDGIVEIDLTLKGESGKDIDVKANYFTGDTAEFEDGEDYIITQFADNNEEVKEIVDDYNSRNFDIKYSDLDLSKKEDIETLIDRISTESKAFKVRGALFEDVVLPRYLERYTNYDLEYMDDFKEHFDSSANDHGIDGLAKNENGDLVIIEAKAETNPNSVGVGWLGDSNDGKQMSESWIKAKFDKMAEQAENSGDNGAKKLLNKLNDENYIKYEDGRIIEVNHHKIEREVVAMQDVPVNGKIATSSLNRKVSESPSITSVRVLKTGRVFDIGTLSPSISTIIRGNDVSSGLVFNYKKYEKDFVGLNLIDIYG